MVKEYAVFLSILKKYSERMAGLMPKSRDLILQTAMRKSSSVSIEQRFTLYLCDVGPFALQRSFS